LTNFTVNAIDRDICQGNERRYDREVVRDDGGAG